MDKLLCQYLVAAQFAVCILQSILILAAVEAFGGSFETFTVDSRVLYGWISGPPLTRWTSAACPRRPRAPLPLACSRLPPASPSGLCSLIRDVVPGSTSPALSPYAALCFFTALHSLTYYIFICLRPSPSASTRVPSEQGLCVVRYSSPVARTVLAYHGCPVFVDSGTHPMEQSVDQSAYSQSVRLCLACGWRSASD